MRNERQVHIRDESGQVIALVAISSVVILLFAALVIDVGNWFSHKRQLQNRADAGALAAGVEYQKSWAACIAGDAATATAIDAAAHKYAGDLNADPTAVNIETAYNANVDVFTNSTSYDAFQTDGGGPCVLHSADDISAAGQWTDVKVKERDLNSFFGSLGIPLPRNIARARVEIRPAISLNGLLPLAVPDRRIEKAQIRYYNECTPNAAPLATANLRPLASPYQTGGGTSYWGPALGSPLPADTTPTGIALTLPNNLTGCQGNADYAPVGVEVRITSEPNVDINGSCQSLITAKFADCFHHLSEIRAYPADAADTQPRIRSVQLAGCNPDGYFSRSSNDTCPLTVSVDVDWGDRDNGQLNVPANFEVKAKLSTGNQTILLDPPSVGSVSGTWTTNAADVLTAVTGPNQTILQNRVQLTLTWNDKDKNHSWRATSDCKAGTPVKCEYNGALTSVHSAVVGTDLNAGVVDLIRTSLGSQTQQGQLLAPYSADALGSANTVFPTLGLRLSLSTGDFTVLRQSGSQATQLLECEPPNGGGVSELRKEIALGCQSWYGKNPFTQGDWWDVGTQSCPDRGLWFNSPAASPYTNSPGNPFRCVPTHPGDTGGPIGDAIKIRTGNCVGNINTISYTCTGNPPCSNPNRYDPATHTYTGNKLRVVNLFVVPYQALKGVIGNNQSQTVPVLGFAAFYITGWNAAGSAQDRCTSDPDGPGGPIFPDDIPANSGEIVGYFIEEVQPNTGPVDPSVACVIGQLTPCRVVLVR